MKTQAIKKVEAALFRINRATQYGDDMTSSSIVCLWDAIGLLEKAIEEETAQLSIPSEKEEDDEACLRG